MMNCPKPLFLFLSFIFNMQVTAQQSLIDNIESKEEALSFLQSEINQNYTFKDIFTNSDKPNSPEVIKEQFLKIDLDQDGSKDLLLYGKFLGAIMSRDGRDFEFHYLDFGRFAYMSYDLIKLDSIAEYDNQPSLIVRHHPNYNEYVDVNDTSEIEIIYKFGNFIPYNASFENKSFKEITFRTTACFGRCPIFKITINENGLTYYEATKFNALSGNFKTQLDEFTIEHLNSFISYLSLEELPEKYADIATDLPTSYLSITYSDNKEKHFRDYGRIGPFQLHALYNYLFKLRKNGNWIKTE